MMLKTKKTFTLSLIATCVLLTACQPKDTEKKQAAATQASTSEVPDTSLQLLGTTEALPLKMPDCDNKNCPEFNVERLKTNQDFVDTIVDHVILKQLKDELTISEQVKKQEDKQAQANKNKKPDQQVPASSVLGESTPNTPAQALAIQIQPYLDNFLSLDNQLKTLGVNHKITLNIGPKILNSDGPLVTVVLNSSSYLGGAHGSTAQHYLNFDLKKKKQVELKDIVAANQQAALENKAHEAFKIWVTDSKLADNVDQYEQSWKFKLSNNFYLGKQGLILQYGEYEIGPYVVGLPRLVIPYEQLQTILKKEYLPEIKADEQKANVQIDKPKS